MILQNPQDITTFPQFLRSVFALASSSGSIHQGLCEAHKSLTKSSQALARARSWPQNGMNYNWIITISIIHNDPIMIIYIILYYWLWIYHPVSNMDNRKSLTISIIHKKLENPNYNEKSCSRNKPPGWKLLYLGWWFQPLWKIWKSVGMSIPNIWKNKKCSKPPTSYNLGWKDHYHNWILIISIDIDNDP